MNLTNFSIKYPFTIVAILLLVAAIGTLSFFKTPTDLFPNSTPPQVSVITVESGASAANVADKITKIIEKELNSISGLKRITSTSRDEVSAINAEFYYDKQIGEAVVDVQNAVSRIIAKLPNDIQSPSIYRITDTTRPLLTLALSPKASSAKKLRDVRLLAENQIMDALLAIPGVADVDVFGANQPEINIRVRKDALAANDLSIGDVIGIISQYNINQPSGNIYTNNREYIVKTYAEFKNLREIQRIPLTRKENGTLYLGDVATVKLTTAEQRSLYHGNGTPAIGVNVMRLSSVGTVVTIRKIKKYLKTLRHDYPDIAIELTTDQSPVIDINVSGMRSSLIQAIILTALIIFIFMADIRAAIVISISIPMAFFFSLIILWFSPFTLNMVTLSGLIISVGMVVDASIVVLENIYRHFRDMKVPDAGKAAIIGTKEVTLSISAGMLTTVVVLIPVMFTGGYTQQIMRPLNLMICTTLIASLLAALTIVPLLTAKLLAKPKVKKNLLERLFSYSDVGIAYLARIYESILKIALRHRFLVILIAVIIFVITMKIVPPLIGKEMMPPMDTGISVISFNTQSDMDVKEVENVINKVEKIIYENKYVIQVSTIVGSEPGQISFGGGGRTTQGVLITIRMTPRNKRNVTIWDVNANWRKSIAKVPGIRDLMVTEYGATPMSTTKAPLDIIISGPNPKLLGNLADEVISRIKNIRGLIDIRRSWYVDKTEYRIEPNIKHCAIYGVTPGKIASEMHSTLKGRKVGRFNLEDYLDIPIRMQYAKSDINNPENFGSIYIPTALGFKPLSTVAKVRKSKIQSYITRENQHNTIDVTASNRIYTIGQVAEMAEKQLKGLSVPAGYKITVAGSMADMKAGNARMVTALLIGLIMLYILLLAMFKSFLHPVTIMAAIPLAGAGAMWGLLMFDKPMCKPAMMGIIFLGGTIVNNSILLLDFIVNARKNGMEKNEAIIQSVKLRIRPILMTTVSTVIGLMPLILEMAVGLERMSPLGIVAAFGLMTGTVLTLIVIPVVYSLLDDLTNLIIHQSVTPISS